MESTNGENLGSTCKHVCLFCITILPQEYLTLTTLENVVPSGNTLIIPLDNPSRNACAFDILCGLLRVKCEMWKGKSKFDERKSLPLCVKCQNLYQEFFQIHIQIQELEKQLNNRVRIIRGVIEKTEKSSGKLPEGVGTQLALLGLDVFRKMVVGVGNNKENLLMEQPPDQFPDSATVSGTESHAHMSVVSVADNNVSRTPVSNIDTLVKQEVEATPGQEDDCEEPPWMGNMEDEESDTNSLSSSADDKSLCTSDNFGGDSSMEPRNSGFEEDQLVDEGRRRSKRKVNKAKTIVDEYVPSEGEDDGGNKDTDDTSNNSGSDEEFEVRRKSPRNMASLTSYPPNKKKRRINIPARRGVGHYATKEYTCHLCSAKSIGRKGLIQHYIQDHPEENRYTCKFCQRHFRNLRDCTIHQRKHTGEKPYKCPSCSCAYSCKKSLSSHMFHIHTDRSGITYPCTKCDKQFSAKSTLYSHLASIHGDSTNGLYISGRQLKSWTCHLCDSVIRGHGAFLQHYIDVHPDEKRYTCKFCKMHYRDLRDCVKHQLRHTGERPFPCPDCSKAFTDAKALRSHQRHMHRDGTSSYRYICKTCGKTYCSKSALTGHMYVHSEALLFCKLCGKCYRNPSGFSKHNRTVHQGKAESSGLVNNPTKETLESLDVPEPQAKIKCHICWTPFSNKMFLKKHFEEKHPHHKGGLNTCNCGKKFDKYQECCKHAVRHSGNKNKTLQCDQCPLRFHTYTELRIHTERHIPVEERKNHVCDICGLKVVSGNALHKHKKKHDKNQPRWVCEQCGKSYSEKKGLVHHTKTEHLKILPFKCTECGKAFALRPDMLKHSRTHSKIKPFKCPLCDKRFPYTSSRARHVREVHKMGETKSPNKRTRQQNQEGSQSVGESHPATTPFEGLLTGELSLVQQEVSGILANNEQEQPHSSSTSQYSHSGTRIEEIKIKSDLDNNVRFHYEDDSLESVG